MRQLKSLTDLERCAVPLQ